MVPSSSISAVAHKLAALVCVAAILSGAAVVGAAGDVATYSFPAFDANTTVGCVAVSNSSFLIPSSLLFDHDAAFSQFNRSEGFLLLDRTVDVWRDRDRPAAGGIPGPMEASFNTSFTLAGAAPVAFVVLRDTLLIGGLRGSANYSASAPNASGSLASVEAGAVRYGYGTGSLAVGLNVTITPNVGAAPSRAVWVEYHATAHRLFVYVAAAGEPKPAKALLDTPLYLYAQTTQTAFVGFFAAAIQDIIAGVRDWGLTVDRFPDGKKKVTVWWVILLAVLGSVAAAAAIVAAVVLYFKSRRRRQPSMEPKV